jgi:hypothetical protein
MKIPFPTWLDQRRLLKVAVVLNPCSGSWSPISSVGLSVAYHKSVSERLFKLQNSPFGLRQNGWFGLRKDRGLSTTPYHDYPDRERLALGFEQFKRTG